MWTPANRIGTAHCCRSNKQLKHCLALLSRFHSPQNKSGRGVGFYFRNVTEVVLFGVRGKNARTLAPGRRQVNILQTRKREHSRKPDELYPLIEACSPGPYLELFARGTREGWRTWGDQADEYDISWDTYSNHSQSGDLGLFVEG